MADWHKQAACRDAGFPDAWFPDDGDHGLRKQAVRICERCPVRLECLVAGMGEEHGVWGGLSTTQRKQLRRTMTERAS